MVELLKYALEKGRYDAAAYAIVYGLIVVRINGNKKGKRKAGKARISPAGLK